MTTIRMQEPVVCGDRVIVPVVREAGCTLAGGVFAGVSPVALLVCECGEWFFIAIEDGFAPGEIAGMCSAEAEPARDTTDSVN